MAASQVSVRYENGDNALTQLTPNQQELYLNTSPILKTNVRGVESLNLRIDKWQFRFETEKPAFNLDADKLRLAFQGFEKPWLPQKVAGMLDRMKKGPLTQKEMSTLIQEIAKVSAEFYRIKPGKFIAVEIDGRIIESGDSAIDVVSKAQSRTSTPFFVWHVGSKLFSGWEP